MNDEPVIPSPGGVPPWDPPDDLGDLLAHDGWAAWVEEHGTLSQRMQLFAYRCEGVAQVIKTAFEPPMRQAAEAVSRFMNVLFPKS